MLVDLKFVHDSSLMSTYFLLRHQTSLKRLSVDVLHSETERLISDFSHLSSVEVFQERIHQGKHSLLSSFHTLSRFTQNLIFLDIHYDSSAAKLWFPKEANTTVFPKLRHLRLCGLYLEEGQTLVQLSFPECLEGLCLTSKDDSPVFILAPSNLKNLVYLETEPVIKSNKIFKCVQFPIEEYSLLSKLESLRILKHGGIVLKEKPLEYTFLSSLQKLEFLDLSHTRLSSADIASISCVDSLVYLDISGCPSSPDLSPLSKLTKLAHLNTSMMRAGKLFQEIKSVVVWNACENFGSFTRNEGDTLSLPSLSHFHLKGDCTLTEDSISLIFTFPSISHLFIANSNVEVEWINNISRARHMKSLQIRECTALKKYCKRQNMLHSPEAVMEKDLTRQILQGYPNPTLDKNTIEFKEYIDLFCVEANKRMKTYATEMTETVKEFLLQNPHARYDLFDKRYKKHPLGDAYLQIHSYLKYHPNEELSINTILYKIASGVKKNWEFVHKNLLKSLRVIDFIPPKFHKHYLGVQVFLSPVWNVEFDLKLLKLEKNMFTSAPALYILLAAKRAKLFLPKIIIKLIISLTK